jgi:hypothetical protein
MNAHEYMRCKDAEAVEDCARVAVCECELACDARSMHASMRAMLEDDATKVHAAEQQHASDCAMNDDATIERGRECGECR